MLRDLAPAGSRPERGASVMLKERMFADSFLKNNERQSARFAVSVSAFLAQQLPQEN